MALGPHAEHRVQGVLVRAAFPHAGLARLLVHRLKYQGSPLIAAVLADAMAHLLPTDASGLIPVPRVMARRWRYGVDQAVEITRELARRSGLPLFAVLRPAAWVPRRAGPASQTRGAPRFSVKGAVNGSAVLVDDVVTTGTTLASAAAATGITRAVVATSAVRP